MSISRTHSALLLCTAISLLPLAGPARAQDAASQENGTTTLEKIVVKGKRACFAGGYSEGGRCKPWGGADQGAGVAVPGTVVSGCGLCVKF